MNMLNLELIELNKKKNINKIDN